MDVLLLCLILKQQVITRMYQILILTIKIKVKLNNLDFNPVCSMLSWTQLLGL